jgi:hypothetical protein
MPRFYFHLTFKGGRISDDVGKELASLNDAYEYARKLIDQILVHVGCDNAEAWKVIIASDEHNRQIIIPFPLTYRARASREVNARKMR